MPSGKPFPTAEQIRLKEQAERTEAVKDALWATLKNNGLNPGGYLDAFFNQITQVGRLSNEQVRNLPSHAVTAMYLIFLNQQKGVKKCKPKSKLQKP